MVFETNKNVQNLPNTCSKCVQKSTQLGSWVLHTIDTMHGKDSYDFMFDRLPSVQMRVIYVYRARGHFLMYIIMRMYLIRVHFLILANICFVFVLQKQDEKRPLQFEDGVPEKEVKKSIHGQIFFVIDQFR